MNWKFLKIYNFQHKKFKEKITKILKDKHKYFGFKKLGERDHIG